MGDHKADLKLVVNSTETSSATTASSAEAATAQGALAKAQTIQATAQQVLLKYTHCSQCRARLHFSYVTDFSRNLTQETARCPECHHQAHRMMHRLQ